MGAHLERAALFGRGEQPQHGLRDRGAVIANEGLDPDSAEALLGRGEAEAVAFGRLAIANPDLVERIRQGAALNRPDPSTFYGGGETGYTDYPALG